MFWDVNFKVTHDSAPSAHVSSYRASGHQLPIYGVPESTMATFWPPARFPVQPSIWGGDRGIRREGGGRPSVCDSDAPLRRHALRLFSPLPPRVDVEDIETGSGSASTADTRCGKTTRSRNCQH